MSGFPWLGVILCICSSVSVAWADDTLAAEADHTIEGRLIIPGNQENFTDIVEETQILINGGAHIGFLKEDYSFEIKNVPAGSYLVQISHPLISFESVRVDITTKGSKRARRVNNLQPHLNHQLQYPIKIRPAGTHNFFHQRETWRITDFLFNPMVLTMVLPVFLIMVLPKLMSAEAMARTQRDVQQIQSAARMSEMPDLSEMMTSLLGNQQGKGGQPARIQGGGQGSSGGGGGGGGGASGSGKKKN